jgi:hypothetical protein
MEQEQTDILTNLQNLLRSSTQAYDDIISKQQGQIDLLVKMNSALEDIHSASNEVSIGINGDKYSCCPWNNGYFVKV